MKSKLSPIRILVLALLLSLGLPSAAQLTSKPAHITIIAIMPENLTLNVNSNNHASLTLGATSDVPGVVTGTTTAWSLTRGRAKVATLATVSYPNVPGMVAEASDIGIRTVGSGAQSDRLAMVPRVTITPVSSTILTEANRRGTSTTEIPTSTRSSQSQTQGTVKIQVQPVL